MNIIGFFILLFILAAAFVSMFMFANHTNTVPVDSYGTTVSQANNLSAGNATHIIMAGTSVIPWIAFIVIVLIIIAVFLWARSQGNSGYNKSRYK